MTNPVILLGTQSNGETLPVQVDDTGRLVAEGLEGPPGPQGDAFTYEDFTPEQLAGLQGPPGPPGEDGADGPNDLKPYGPEYSYLIIQNGKPTWVANGSDPNPPGPTDPVMLIDKRDEVVSGWSDYGCWSDSGTPAFPSETWDAYLRQQSTWETPSGLASGLGGVPLGNSQKLPFTLSIVGAFEKVLEITVAFQSETAEGYLTNHSAHDLAATTTNSYLTPLVTSYSNEAFGPAGLNWKLNTFTWFVSRPDPGLADIEVALTYHNSGRNTYKGAFLQRWVLMDTATYLIKRQLAKNEAAQMPIS